MNRKKLEGELITLGYNREDTDNILIQLDELFSFAEYMKSKYDLDDKEYEKMYQLYADRRESETEERLMEGIDVLDDDDIIIDKMTQSVINLSIEMMNDFANLHGYEKMEEYRIASDIYINKLLKDQIVKAMRQVL